MHGYLEFVAHNNKKNSIYNCTLRTHSAIYPMIDEYKQLSSLDMRLLTTKTSVFLSGLNKNVQILKSENLKCREEDFFVCQAERVMQYN